MDRYVWRRTRDVGRRPRARGSEVGPPTSTLLSRKVTPATAPTPRTDASRADWANTATLRAAGVSFKAHSRESDISRFRRSRRAGACPATREAAPRCSLYGSPGASGAASKRERCAPAWGTPWGDPGKAGKRPPQGRAPRPTGQSGRISSSSRLVDAMAACLGFQPAGPVHQLLPAKWRNGSSNRCRGQPVIRWLISRLRPL